MLTHHHNNDGSGSPSVDGTRTFIERDAAVSKPPRTILVVDDNADAADTLAGILQAWGYQTLVAHDGPAALAALQDVVPDIALLDIGMPAMDGYELAAHLRFQPGCEEMPIVAITGFGGPEAARRSRAKGFAAHLVKPVDPASLAQLLK
jgi:CheY-like chemotaxis protein